MKRRQFLGSALASLLTLPFPVLAGKKPTVTVIVKSLQNQYFTLMIDGAKQHQAKHANDYNLIVEGLKNESDLQEQEALIKQSLARRDEVLIVAPVDSSASIPLLLKAIRNKTLVINLDNKLDERSLAKEGVSIPFVGPSNFNGAKQVGDYVVRKLKPGSKVGIIEGIAESINAKSRSDGFRKAISGAEMSLAGLRWGYWETDKAQKAAQELLAATPGLAALLCGNDNMAIGAAQIVQAQGKTGKILIGGYDNIPAIKAYLADGRIIATADQHPGLQVQYAIDLGLNGLKNKASQDSLQAIVQTPVDLVTKG